MEGPAWDALIRIGWLRWGDDYPTGAIDPAAYAKLVELCRNPWMPMVSGGFHQCELCQFEPARMKDELYLPGQGVVYLAPIGIAHYISAHWYLPPPDFLEAVMACPPMRSMEYKRALLANGGRGLVRSGS